MNPYSLEVATAGNWIQFADGSKREIIDISDDGTNIIMKLDGEGISYGKNGSLDNAIFLNAKGEQFHKSLLQAYRSQYGLQGKVFKHLALPDRKQRNSFKSEPVMLCHYSICICCDSCITCKKI